MNTEVQTYRVEQLEKDMTEVKGKIAEFALHVAECAAIKKEQMRWMKIAVVGGLGLLGLGGHDEAIQLIGGL